MYLINFGLIFLFWTFFDLVVKINFSIKFESKNIENIYLLDHLTRQKIINIYYCFTWWSPNQSFSSKI
jgi:hypothetical protein